MRGARGGGDMRGAGAGGICAGRGAGRICAGRGRGGDMREGAIYVAIAEYTREGGI